MFKEKLKDLHYLFGLIAKIGAATAFLYTSFATVEYVDKGKAEAKEYTNAKYETIYKLLLDTHDSVKRMERKLERRNHGQ